MKGNNMRKETKEMLGKKYGHLTVVGFTKENGEKGRTLCKCICDCGRETTANPRDLKIGKKKSCGCEEYGTARPSMRKDLTGTRIGSFVVTEMIYGTTINGRKVTKCKCRCDCGNEIEYYANNITSGKIPTCKKCGKKRIRKSRRKDLTGQTFGRLTVVEMLWKDETRSKTMCRCICECGNEYIVGSDRLTSGKTTSCGCERKEKKIIKLKEEYIGHKYNRLTIDDIYYDEKGDITAKCICDCGNTKITKLSYVVRNEIKSCGCLLLEQPSLKKDYSGIKSEYNVEILRQAESNGPYNNYWVCKCGLCGNEFIALPANVITGKTKSCGCVKRSFHEQYIYNLLSNENIKFETEYQIPECRNVKPLPFDFAVFDNHGSLSFLIEYDGYQHNKPVDFFGGESGFVIRKNNDNIKNDYCADNNIDLLRIPYSMSLNDIELVITNELNNHCISVTTAGCTWQHVC